MQGRLYLFGFSRWKHRYIRTFLREYDQSDVVFINSIYSTEYSLALKRGLNSSSKIFIWGKKQFPEIERFTEQHNIKITRVEDGFLRSIRLGSDFTRPYSLIFDDEGIYFDSTQPSRLENILNTYDFDDEILTQAQQLYEKILCSKISKYNNATHKNLNFPCNKIKILVPGQVETDASIKYGSTNMTNLMLLEEVKKNNPNAYIIYKPHPDVLSGNRKGDVGTCTTRAYCDCIITDASVASLLQAVDEVHTITSLVGLEGLLYGKKVITYGMPFYAGWGLTHDLVTEQRRVRELTLYQLIAGAYILYPKYIHPKTLEYCSGITLIEQLTQEKIKLDNNLYYNIKVKLHRLYRKFINIYISK